MLRFHSCNVPGYFLCQVKQVGCVDVDEPLVLHSCRNRKIGEHEGDRIKRIASVRRARAKAEVVVGGGTDGVKFPEFGAVAVGAFLKP